MARLVSLFPLLCFPWIASGAWLGGTVLEYRSSRPVARATVRIDRVQAGANSSMGSVLTDSGGRYRLSVPAGTYLVRAEKKQYVTGKYGQLRWNGAGSPIVLEDASQFYAEVRLRRLGVITGEVWDENQIGLPEQPVFAFRAGKLPLRAVSSGISDDRGNYRIPGIPPGKYYVRTGPRELEGRRGLLPTYLGQTTIARESRIVEVELDMEAPAGAIEPIPGRLGSIEGSAPGTVPVQVSLYSETGKQEVQTTPPLGRFAFGELAPGTYRLLAVTLAGEPLADYRELYVGQQVTPVALRLRRMPLVDVRFEVKGRSTVEPAGVSVFLRRNEPPEPASAMVRPGGAVAIPPGEYTAGAIVPSHTYVEYIRIAGGRPGPGESEFTAESGETVSILIGLSGAPASLSGKVLTPSGEAIPGAPVFLNPVDPSVRSRFQMGRSTRTDKEGFYQFWGLPPGQYQVFGSFEDQEPEESDWAAIESKKVSLGEGQPGVLNLEIKGAQ